MDKYPKWAPHVLTCKAEHLKSQPEEEVVVVLSNERLIKLLTMLTTDERMKMVWDKLRSKRIQEQFQKNSKLKESPDQWPVVFFDLPEGYKYRKPFESELYLVDRSQAYSLYSACIRAIYQYQQRPVWTKRQTQGKYDQIIKHAKALAVLLDEFKIRPDGYKRINYLSNICEYVDKSDIENTCLFEAADNYYRENIERFDQRIYVDPLAFIDLELNGIIPNLVKVLNKLCVNAKAERESVRALPQPNAQNAEQLFFSEELSEYFYKYYGSGHVGIIANIRSAVYQCEVDVDTLRKHLSNRPKRKSAQ